MPALITTSESLPLPNCHMLIRYAHVPAAAMSMVLPRAARVIKARLPTVMSAAEADHAPSNKTSVLCTWRYLVKALMAPFPWLLSWDDNPCHALGGPLRG